MTPGTAAGLGASRRPRGNRWLQWASGALLALLLCGVAPGGSAESGLTWSADANRSEASLSKVKIEAARHARETAALEDLDVQIAELGAERGRLISDKPDKLLGLEVERDAEVGQLQDTRDQEKRTMDADHAAIMAEYRDGVFCKGCDRTRTEFVGGGNSASSWPQHTADNGGTYDVSDDEIRAKQAQLDAEGKNLWDKHQGLIEASQEGWRRKTESMTKILDGAITDLDDLIAQAYAARRDVVIQQINARDQTGQGTDKYFDELFREHTDVVRQRVKSDARQSSLAYREDDLREEFNALQAEYESMKAAFAAKWPMSAAATPAGQLAERMADHDLGSAALARAQAQGKRVQQVREQQATNREQRQELESQYKQRRTDEIQEVRGANLEVFDNDHRVRSTGWLFAPGVARNPNVAREEPDFEQALAQAFQNDADQIEELLAASQEPSFPGVSRSAIDGAIDWLTPDSLRGVELSIDAEAMATTVLGRVMQGKRDLPTGAELRKDWTSTKRWGGAMLDKIAVQAESLRHYGKQYVDLDDFEQRSVDLWDSATRGVISSPFWGQMTKVDRFGDFMDLIGEEVPTWMDPQ